MVVLPVPLGPMTPTMPAGGSVQLRFSYSTRSPKAFLDVYKRQEYMSAIYPVGTLPAQIVVREEDAEWAAALLRSMDGEDAAK